MCIPALGVCWLNGLTLNFNWLTMLFAFTYIGQIRLLLFDLFSSTVESRDNSNQKSFLSLQSNTVILTPISLDCWQPVFSLRVRRVFIREHERIKAAVYDFSNYPIFQTNFRFPRRIEKSGFHCSSFNDVFPLHRFPVDRKPNRRSKWKHRWGHLGTIVLPFCDARCLL